MTRMLLRKSLMEDIFTSIPEFANSIGTLFLASAKASQFTSRELLHWFGPPIPKPSPSDAPQFYTFCGYVAQNSTSGAPELTGGQAAPCDVLFPHHGK